MTDGSLKRSQLKMILNTQSGSQVFTTLITPNHGQNMYTTETESDHDPINIYRSMINDIEHSHVAERGNIWANYSPCPLCAKALLSHYGKTDKPTIHVARIYTASNNISDVVKSLQCLAKLEHEGFSIYCALEFHYIQGICNQ